MAPPRVLIVCTWFPPVNAPGSRRPFHLARCLQERGWAVSVLTSEPETDTASWGHLDGVRILRAPRTAATHDLNGAQRLLLRALATTQKNWVHGPLRVLADLALPFRHSLRWDLSPDQIEMEIGPQDVIVATSPDPTVFDTGARLAHKWGALWAVDYRDPWNVAIPAVAKDIITHQGSGLAGMLRRARMRTLERRFCGHADVLTAVSKAFLANAMATTGLNEGTVIQGGFVSAPPPAHRKAGHHFILTHTGQLYPEQSWPVFFEALNVLRRSEPGLFARLRVRFIGAASTHAPTMDLLDRAGRELGIIERLPPVHPDESIRTQRDSDALLQLALAGRKGYLPVKFLEYLGAGRPIVLLSNEQDEMEDALTSTRTGVILRDARSMAAHLADHLRAHQAGTPLPFTPSAEALSAFDYAANMHRWGDLLEEALRRKG